MVDIDFLKIEKKWQKAWESEGAFKSSDKSSKKKYYVLEMFPYPSSEGLHMGHVWNYTIGDIFARFKRMNGFNVMYPMGFDSLGLPAENAAIDVKEHPKPFTEKAIKNYIRQMKEIGLSYDWNRTLSTSDPKYYKWDQWIFLKMLEKGLAYKKISVVNFCSECNTVLANEQVHKGKCWRHEDINVEIKHLNQWYFKITDYAEELNDFSELNEWPDMIKKLQKNWIGKSHGVEVDFEINGVRWPIFTTRIDTIFGVTFMVVSAQHSKLMGFVSSGQKKEVEKFVKRLSSVSEEDIQSLEKEGVFTGSYAKNPINGEEIPIYAGNFVLADYGSGMVMAVPAHDKRDFEFAEKYNIEIKEVISGGDVSKEAYVKDGKLINSDEFNGMGNRDAIEKIAKYLEKKKLGRKVVNFRLRDWLISRQRYWGTPIPIINCDSCGAVPVSEEDLPVLLPEDVKFGKGNPIETNKEFVNVKCPKCDMDAKRETDTMDTFVNSSWYFLRYLDNKNENEIFDSKIVNSWCPVDFYVGGKEHACMHLIYVRFYTKFLRDLGLLKFNEPAVRLFNQGVLHGEDGFKMSKSKGNGILPEVVSKKYGIDTARLFLVSLASPDKDIDWSEKGINGSLKFIKRVVEFSERIRFGKTSVRVISKVNKAVKLISEDIENMRYNLAVIKMRQLFESFEDEISIEDYKAFLKMFSVFSPHIAEELWEKSNGEGFISLSSWPKFDEKKIDRDLERREEMVDKLKTDIFVVKKIVGKDDAKVYVYVMPNELEIYSEVEEIYLFAVNEDTKYDPEGKASRAKPGKPAIYLE